MPRYITRLDDLDDVPLTAGDAAFSGFASRPAPVSLPAGLASVIENGRIDQGAVRCRKGCRALMADAVLHIEQLVLGNDDESGWEGLPPVTLAVDTPGVAIAFAGGTATVSLASALPAALNAPGFINVFATGGEALPRAFEGDHKPVSTGGDGMSFTFAPSDTTEAPPAEWEGGFAVNNGPVIASAEDDEVRGSAVITDLRNRELIIMALIDRAFVYQPGLPLRTVAYPEGVTLLPGQRVELLQYLNQVFIFRGSLIDGAANLNHAALVWNMRFSNEAADQFRLVPQGAHPSGEPDLVMMPAADWAVAFNRQLVLPFGRDQLILSDFGDAHTYNIVASQIRILPGGNDWLAGVAPYQQTRILILYRKSVHLAVLSSTDLAIEGVHEITRQFGCSARNTVVTCGGAVLWLSDGGVHALQIGQELNLTAAGAPLSEPVADIMGRVNVAAAGRACAVFHDNRYWLALPLDGGGVNNAVLVFNFLTGGWESLDTFPAGFDIQNFCVIEHGGARRLHAVTTFGYVYLLEEREDGRDESGDIASGTLTQVAFRLVTRGLAFGTVEPKRFSYLQLDAGAGAGDAVMVSVNVRNPDAVVQLPPFAGVGGGDVSSRRWLRARGVVAQVEVAAAAGRPSVGGFMMEAAAANRRAADY